MATKKKAKKAGKKGIEDMTVTLGKNKGHTKIDPNERDYEITEASIKDMLCNYSLTVTGEENHGDKMKVVGQGIVMEDMLNAMAKFNVHLACLDDAFKTAGIEVEDIDTMRGHELTGNYMVTGFKIKGGAGNEHVILMGHKYVSASDHMQLTTPKIPLNQSSSYTWYNELSDVCELIREEVSLYREGKYTEKEPKEKEDPDQIIMFSEKDPGEAGFEEAEMEAGMDEAKDFDINPDGSNDN